MKKQYDCPIADTVLLRTEDVMTLSSGVAGKGLTFSYQDILSGMWTGEEF